MVKVRWRLREFLQAEGLSAYQLHKVIEGEVSRTGLYRIFRNQTAGVDFHVLGAVLTGLESLLRRPVEIWEVIEKASQ